MSRKPTVRYTDWLGFGRLFEHSKGIQNILATVIVDLESGASESRSCRHAICRRFLDERGPRTITQRAFEWYCECSGPDALIENIVAPELERPPVILSSDPRAHVNPDIRFLDVAGERKVGSQNLGREGRRTAFGYVFDHWLGLILRAALQHAAARSRY